MMHFNTTGKHAGDQKDQMLAAILAPGSDDTGAKRVWYDELLASAQRNITSIDCPGDEGAMVIDFDWADLKATAQLAYTLATGTGRAVRYWFNGAEITISPPDTRICRPREQPRAAPLRSLSR